VRVHQNLTSLVLTTALAMPAAARQEAAAPAAVEASVRSYVDGTMIHYHVQGRGSPAIVLIHCWMGDSSFWREQVPVLAKTHRVVTLDLPGHGQSGKDRRVWNMPSFGLDVKSVVESAGLDKVILAGNSMGGYVMLEAEHVMPDHVIGLIAVDTLLNADARHDPKEDAAFHDALQKDFRGTTNKLARDLCGKKAPPAVVDGIAATMSSGDPAIGLALMDDLDRYDLAASLRKTHAPIVAINSAARPTNVEANRKYVKKYDLILLPDGIGHFPQLEAPRVFSDLLARALAMLPAR
jgi:pimeloyl-ACP methyl ester carboxylesterase